MQIKGENGKNYLCSVLHKKSLTNKIGLAYLAMCLVSAIYTHFLQFLQVHSCVKPRDNPPQSDAFACIVNPPLCSSSPECILVVRSNYMHHGGGNVSFFTRFLPLSDSVDLEQVNVRILPCCKQQETTYTWPQAGACALNRILHSL